MKQKYAKNSQKSDEIFITKHPLRPASSSSYTLPQSAEQRELLPRTLQDQRDTAYRQER